MAEEYTVSDSKTGKPEHYHNPVCIFRPLDLYLVRINWQDRWPYRA